MWRPLLKIAAPVTEQCLYMVRHGKTEYNSDGKSIDRIRGWIDVQLDDEGKEQAQLIGEFFKDKPIDAVFSSDLDRAEDTAQPIADTANVEVQALKVFRPWNLGDYEGQDSKYVTNELKTKFVDHPTKQVPNGESFADFSARFTGALAHLLHDIDSGKYRCVVLVAHYRNLKLTEAWLDSGMSNDHIDKDTFMSDDTSPASVIKLTKDGDIWKWQKEETPVERNWHHMAYVMGVDSAEDSTESKPIVIVQNNDGDGKIKFKAPDEKEEKPKKKMD